MAATLKDIARKLNISVSTVSYALNGGPRSVPEEVRLKVLEVARELQYRPNRLARSLITGRSHTIGVVPPRRSANMILGLFFQECLNGVVNAAEETLQDIMFFTRFDVKTDQKLVDSLLDGRVDGAIFIAPPDSCEVIHQVASRGLPCASISVPIDGKVINLLGENVKGTQAALEHLWDLGHRKIGFFGRSDWHEDLVERVRLYEAFMADHGVPIDPDWIVDSDFNPNVASLDAKRLLREPNRPTAFLCANDELAFAIMLGAQEIGLRVPGDLSVVGFDDTHLCLKVFPNLTTVAQPLHRMGEDALKAVVEAVETQHLPASKVYDTSLIIRNSTAPPAHQS
ncbi:MAG: LacI family DNA-binding transcriptional regulator [Fimbriimonas sp.]